MSNVDDKNVLRRGRPRAIGEEDRRQSILKSAYNAFITLGFSRTTTAVIAAGAKVSKRTLYETFGDKTELFAAVIHEHRHLILELPRPEGEELPLDETLYQIFRLDMDEERAKAREAMLNLITREAILFPELSDYLYRNAVIRSRELLLEWLEYETVKGRIVLDDPQVYAGMLMDVVFGALIPHRKKPGDADRSLRIAHIKKRIAIVLYSMQPHANAASER